MNKVTPAELWLTIAPEWIQNLPEWREDILFKGYKCFIYGDRYMLFLKGLKNTLILTFYLNGNNSATFIHILRSYYSYSLYLIYFFYKRIVYFLLSFFQSPIEVRIRTILPETYLQ